MDHERLGIDVPQEAQAGNDAAEGPRLGHDVDELNLQQVTGLSALDQNRARKGMHGAGGYSAEVRHCAGGV